MLDVLDASVLSLWVHTEKRVDDMNIVDTFREQIIGFRPTWQLGSFLVPTLQLWEHYAFVIHGSMFWPIRSRRTLAPRKLREGMNAQTRAPAVTR